MKPLIDLMQWVAEASDAEFVAELAQHVEIESLARSIALQDLLDNFDDMAGPGKSYYLWYDLESERFTVVSWDLNLALGSFGGPGGQGPFGGSDGMGALDLDAMFSCFERVAREEGKSFGGPGGLSMGHPIKDRFLAAPRFRELYAREYAAVYDALFADGHAAAELARLAGVIAGSGLVEEATVESEANDIRSKLGAQAARGPVPPDPSAPEIDHMASPTVATPVPASPTP